jgi:hypothetical protein
VPSPKRRSSEGGESSGQSQDNADLPPPLRQWLDGVYEVFTALSVGDRERVCRALPPLHTRATTLCLWLRDIGVTSDLEIWDVLHALEVASMEKTPQTWANVRVAHTRSLNAIAQLIQIVKEELERGTHRSKPRGADRKPRLPNEVEETYQKVWKAYKVRPKPVDLFDLARDLSLTHRIVEDAVGCMRKRESRRKATSTSRRTRSRQ